jgi:hypothetical protein
MSAILTPKAHLNVIFFSFALLTPRCAAALWQEEHGHPLSKKPLPLLFSASDFTARVHFDSRIHFRPNVEQIFH